MNLFEIKEKLLIGDIKAISMITGLSPVYCRKVLSNNRNVKSINSKKIIRVATKIIGHREKLKIEMN